MARIGEIVETSTVRLIAESDRLHDLPPLGAIVRISAGDGGAVYGVVSFGVTGGLDPSRPAVRRGSDAVRDDEIYRRHPELNQILRTMFEIVPIAFTEDGRTVPGLPPVPPRLHYSVEPVDPTELRRLTDQARYLSLLARHQGDVPGDALLAAHVRYVYRARGGDSDWLDRIAQDVARLLNADYDRLVEILEAIDPDV
mgnify:FL=1